jgi:hypothetical protein
MTTSLINMTPEQQAERERRLANVNVTMGGPKYYLDTYVELGMNEAMGEYMWVKKSRFPEPQSDIPPYEEPA